MDSIMIITPKLIFFCMLTIMTIYLLLTKNYLPLKKKYHNNTPLLQSKLRKYSSLNSSKLDDSQDTALVVHVEEGLLKSCSIFPYFMLVAFEGGGILRAIVVLLLYPFVCLLSKDMKVKVLVLFCFFGLKAEKFRVGRFVLPKFFLEDVGHEVYDEVMDYKRIVAVSDLPRVMIEVFVMEYLGIDVVIGRELKVVSGYFVGIMEEKKNTTTNYALFNEVKRQGKLKSLVGINSISSCFAQQLLSACEEIYMVSTSDKRKWSILPKDKYHKKLIFHDGRLAFRPTFCNTLSMFLWLPFGLLLCIVRLFVAFVLPYKLSLPILAFTGIKITASNNSATELVEAVCGCSLYVCNHRTLLDPIVVSLTLMRPVTAVTYGVSRVSELISPIKTTPLKRNREHDLMKMKELLCKGDVVVCPEGTTCREPYLLRLGPLFAEVSDNIVPVALNVYTSMFYGTTASGLKCLDPIFFLLNPCPVYMILFLERLAKRCTCCGGKSNIQVAKHVQKEIAKALGFECTNITRKDKYMILVGNEGIV